MTSRVLLSVLLLLAFFLPYQFYPAGWWGSDLTANLFAGAVDIVITLLGVDFILRKSEERRSLPIRFAVYRESRIVFHRIRAIWVELVKSSVASFSDLDGEMFQQRFASEISHHMNLDAKPENHFYANWLQRITLAAIEIEGMTDTIISRYQSHINIEIFNSLQDMKTLISIAYMKSVQTLYNMSPDSAPAGKNRFPEIVDFEKHDGASLRRFHETLTKKGMEFRHIEGYVPPPPLTFQDDDRRNDVLPRLGSARI